jgi:hypothetical protein
VFTCNITDVVTDVVSDYTWVAMIVLRNALSTNETSTQTHTNNINNNNNGYLLDFTDQIGTDIGGFGVDTAADTCEQRNR